MVQLTQVSYTYPPGTAALRGIDLSLSQGEVLALLGPNGSGKTTLLKQIVGLLTPTQGNITLHGHPLSHFKPRKLYTQLGMVFQDPHDQLFCHTVAQEVAFGPQNLGLAPEEVTSRVTLALQRVGLKGYEDKPIQTLSFGQKKRLCLAGILAMRPMLMLLDEPTGGLDPLAESAAMQLLKTINHTQGISLLIATHQVDMVPLFADRVCLLRKGQVVALGPTTEILSNPQLIRKVGLRLPRVTHLLEILAKRDNLPIAELPLTIGQARQKLLDHLANKHLWPGYQLNART